MSKPDPLHGLTLEAIVTALVAHYGWEELGRQVPIRCFQKDPSVPSSLKFLRRTPWARAKVESLYLFVLRERKRSARAGAPCTLRVLGPDDWPVWRELRLAALAGDPAAFGSKLADWQGDGDREERWRARLSVPGAIDLVAERDGVPVGMASGFPDPDDSTVRALISMWVAPSVRGHGVGDALVDAVIRWARRGGAAGLGLSVVAGNEPATELYLRHGFDFTGEVSAPGPDGRRELRMLRSFDDDEPARTPHRGG